MAKIANINSLLNYIATQSALPVEVVRTWFPEYTTELGQCVLTYQTAVRILATMLRVGFGKEWTWLNNYPANTAADTIAAEILYKIAMSGLEWNVKTAPNQCFYGKAYKILHTDFNLNVNLIGGGSGGSGAAYAAQSSKNSTSVAMSGAGSAGERTVLLRGVTRQLQAQGPASSTETLPVETSAVGSGSENRIQGIGGVNGQASGTILIQSRNAFEGNREYTEFMIYAGYGGAGGGGVTNKSSNNSEIKAEDGFKATGGNAAFGDDLEINLSSSGAGGGSGWEIEGNSAEFVASAAPSNPDSMPGSAGQDIRTITYGECAKGGMARLNSYSTPSSIIGAGGTGGRSLSMQYPASGNIATGGDGGNSGGCIIHSYENFWVNQLD